MKERERERERSLDCQIDVNVLTSLFGYVVLFYF